MKLAPRKSRRKLYDDDSEDNGGICSHCDMGFDNFSQFIRHVTHSKACKDGYDEKYPGLIQKYRRTARLKSRRKAYHTLVNGPKGEAYREHRENRRKNNIKVYHIPARVKKSDCGRAFEQIFKDTVFQESIEEAKVKIEQQAKDHDTCNEALDFAFMDWPSMYLPYTDEFEYFKKTEAEILEDIFERMEERYNYMRNKLNEKYKEKWKKDTYYSITYELLPATLHKAFLTCYTQHFKPMYDIAIDSTLDTVFQKLVVTEGYFDEDKDLSKQLETAFRTLLKDEITRMAKEDHPLQIAMKSVMNTEFKKRFVSENIEYLELK